MSGAGALRSIDIRGVTLRLKVDSNGALILDTGESELSWRTGAAPDDALRPETVVGEALAALGADGPLPTLERLALIDSRLQLVAPDGSERAGIERADIVIEQSPEGRTYRFRAMPLRASRTSRSPGVARRKALAKSTWRSTPSSSMTWSACWWPLRLLPVGVPDQRRAACARRAAGADRGRVQYRAPARSRWAALAWRPSRSIPSRRRWKRTGSPERSTFPTERSRRAARGSRSQARWPSAMATPGGSGHGVRYPCREGADPERSPWRGRRLRSKASAWNGLVSPR